MEFSVVTLLWLMYALSCAIGGGLLVWVLLGYFDPVPPTAMSPCDGVRKVYGDYTECSCGVGWDTNDPYPPEGHSSRVVPLEQRKGMVLGKTVQTLVAGVDAHGAVVTNWAVLARSERGWWLAELTAPHNGTRVVGVVDQAGGYKKLEYPMAVDAGDKLYIHIGDGQASHG
jgi:hypothetical protein